MGASGSGKIDADEHPRLPRPADHAAPTASWARTCRRFEPRRAGRAAPRGIRLRLPELQPDRHGIGARERRGAGGLCRHAARTRRDARARALLGTLGLARAARPPAQPALRRPAAARLDRARADERRRSHPGRRAHRRARQQERRRGAWRCCRISRAQGHTVILITHAREVAAARASASSRSATATSSPTRDRSAGAIAGAAARAQPRRRRGLAAPAALEAAKTALRALRANLFRTVLTLLGIVIGVASVIAMLAIGDGAKQAVLDRISAMGTNLLLVRPGARRPRAAPAAARRHAGAGGRRRHRRAAQRAGRRARARRQRHGALRQLRLPDAGDRRPAPTYPLARNWPVARGTFFSAADVQRAMPRWWCSGRRSPRTLFPDGDGPDRPVRRGQQRACSR